MQKPKTLQEAEALELTSLRRLAQVVEEYLGVAKESFTEPELRHALELAVTEHKERHGVCYECYAPIEFTAGALNGRECSDCGAMIHYGCGCGRNGNQCSVCHESRMKEN